MGLRHLSQFHTQVAVLRWVLPWLIKFYLEHCVLMHHMIASSFGDQDILTSLGTLNSSYIPSLTVDSSFIPSSMSDSVVGSSTTSNL